MVASPSQYSPAEVARLSEETGKTFELVRGVLVEKDRRSMISNGVATEIVYRLKATYGRERAFVAVAQPVCCFGPEQMRVPDVTLVWMSRLEGGFTDDDLHVVPDLVVEVVSPTNPYEQIYDRLEEFRNAGAPLAWIVDPGHRFVHVYRADGSGELIRAENRIENEPSLPGFSVKIADLFP